MYRMALAHSIMLFNTFTVSPACAAVTIKPVLQLGFAKLKNLANQEAICFSKLESMHDMVIGLLINKVEFGRDIYT